jgi:hypothetical protein
MYEPHEVASVRVRLEGSGHDGYLVATAGENIEVIRYENCSDDGEGWVFARLCRRLQTMGWVSTSVLDLPQQSATTPVPLQMGMVVSTVQPVTPEPNSGYLHTDAGTPLEVLYVGKRDEDQDWIYARILQPQSAGDERGASLLNGNSCSEGWLRTSEVNFFKAELPSMECPSALLATQQAVHMQDISSPAVVDNGLEPCLSPRPFSQCSHSPICLSPQPLTDTPKPSRPCPMPEDAKEAPTHPIPPPPPRSAPPPLQPALQASRQLRKPIAGSLRLITFGLENSDSDLYNRCMDEGRANGDRGPCGAYAQFEESELRAALERKKERDVDLVLDARRFPDPGAQHNIRHIGVHPDIICGIVYHSNFRSYLKDVRSLWREAMSKKRSQPGALPQLVIALYCKAGKHRSVAVAEVLRSIGEHVECLRSPDH